jgi:tripartite-type tricarboxylate transporter receptor subunit TctC
MKATLIRLICLLLAFGALSGAALGQGYPKRAITILVGFPPGGGTDLLSRLVAQKLNEKWGVPVLVDNRPGGNGIIGARAAATAQPDGYTLYMGSSDHLVLVPSQYDGLPYDALKDFVAVVPVANQHLVLVVHPSLSVRSVDELVAYAKANPGKLNFASWGSGALAHLTGEFFQKTTGVSMVHVPYKGTAPAVAELLSGQDVKVMFATIASSTPHIRSGKLRPLALTAAQRSAALPDVPTTAEVGLSGFVMFSWNGLFAPAGTPKEIVDSVNREVLEILRMPDVVARLATLGVEPTGGTPEDFAAFHKSELERWGRIVRDAGIPRQKLN